MSATGSPGVGDFPVMSVESSVTAIKKGDVLYFTDLMEITPVTSSARDKIAGIAAEDYPKVTGSASSILYGSEATDQGPSTYSSVGTRNKIAVQMEGMTWLNVETPAGSSTDVVLVFGDRVVPALEAGTQGNVALYVEAPSMAGPSEAQIQAAFAEQGRIIGKCMGNLHYGLKSNSDLLDEAASLGTSEVANGTLTAAAAIKYGKVFVKLNIR